MKTNSRKSVKVAVALAGLGLAMGLSACGSSAAGEESGFTEISYGSTPGNQEYLPLWVAQDHGFFEEQGIRAKSINVDSGPAANTLLIGGSIDVSLLPVSAVFQDWSNKKPITIVSGSKTDLGVALMGPAGQQIDEAKSAVDRIKDLAGAKISVPARGSLIELQVADALRTAGLDPSKDVTFVAIASRPDTLAGALKSGAVDVVSSTGVNKVGFVDRGLSVPIVQLNELEGRQPGADMVFGMTEKYLKSNPDSQDKVNAALEKSILWMKDPANLDSLVETFEKHSPGATDIGAQFKKMWTSEGLNESALYGPDVSEDNFAEAARFFKITSDKSPETPSYEEIVYEKAR